MKMRRRNGICRERTPSDAGEKAFDQRWALTVLEEALARLRDEYLASGRAEIFERLQVYLSSETSPGDYDTLAPNLGMSPNALGVAGSPFAPALPRMHPARSWRKRRRPVPRTWKSENELSVFSPQPVIARAIFLCTPGTN